MAKTIELWEDWWTKPEDASKELTLARENLRKSHEKWKKTIARFNEEEQRFIYPKEGN